nr:MAG TPA: hypothetical protein [Caudoviricetes sp.]
MFEKEAKEYATENYENCLYDDFPYTNDSKVIEKSFKEGAEFAYNKAKEIIKNLINSLMVIDGEEIRELSVVKEAERFLNNENI